MSLNPKKNTTKHLEITGTQKDFDVLADVLKQAAERLNVDIYPEDIDIPGRITLKKQGKATQWQYPKLSKALHAFAAGLKDEGGGVVNFESPQITDEPKEVVLNNPTLRLMNQTSVGKRLGVGQFIKEDILGDFDKMLDNRTSGARSHPLLKMSPTWVYAKNIALDSGVPVGTVARDLKTLAKIKQYPVDLNKMSGWKEMKKEGYNQAYFVIFRADQDFPLEMPLATLPGEWDRWVKQRPVPKSLSHFVGKPPRNMGDYVERFAVYTTARTFGLTDAFLAPVYVGAKWDGQKVGGGKLLTDKILMTEPIKSKGGGDMSDYATYYGFVVVGKGRQRTPSLGEEKPDMALDLPGFE